MNNITLIDSRTGCTMIHELPTFSAVQEAMRDGFTPVFYSPECMSWKQWRVNELKPRFEFREIGKSICIDGTLYPADCLYTDRRGAELYIAKEYYSASKYQVKF